jgi:hypothetical protein
MVYSVWCEVSHWLNRNTYGLIFKYLTIYLEWPDTGTVKAVNGKGPPEADACG